MWKPEPPYSDSNPRFKPLQFLQMLFWKPEHKCEPWEIDEEYRKKLWDLKQEVERGFWQKHYFTIDEVKERLALIRPAEVENEIVSPRTTTRKQGFASVGDMLPNPFEEFDDVSDINN